MLKSFSIKNYRNLNIEDIRFKKINVFIGPNNSGKSNLIGGINFCSDLVTSERSKSHVSETVFYEVLSKHGFGDILDRRLEKPGCVEMSWRLTNLGSFYNYRYDLKFQVNETRNFPKGFKIVAEELKADFGNNKVLPIVSCHQKNAGKGEFRTNQNNSMFQSHEVELEVSQKETIFAQLMDLLETDKFRNDIFPSFSYELKVVKEAFSRFEAYSSSDFYLKSIRKPQEIGVNLKFLTQDGTNFVNVLSYLDEQHNFLQDYKTILQDLIPPLTALKIETASDGDKELFLTIDGKTFKLSEMSDGTIQSMLLALLLFTPERMSILSLDEPELNIHPAWLKVIASWVVRSTSSDQILISTHSPDFLDWITDDYRDGRVALFVSDLRAQQTIQSVDPAKLDTLFEEGWQLGDLYRVGNPVLGGWPW